MPRVSLDSSALLERVVSESESEPLQDHLAREVEQGSLRCLGVPDPGGAASAAALAGVHLSPSGEEVVALARRTGPPLLGTLDALHLATAVLLDVDVVIAYDQHLLESAAEAGLAIRDRCDRRARWSG